MKKNGLIKVRKRHTNFRFIGDLNYINDGEGGKLQLVIRKDLELWKEILIIMRLVLGFRYQN